MDGPRLARTRRELQGRLAELRNAGASGRDTYRELVPGKRIFRTLEICRRRHRHPPMAPRRSLPRHAATPFSDSMLGLHSGSARLRLNAFDRRIRQADEVEHELQIPLLAKLPTPGRGDAPTILERAPDETTEASGGCAQASTSRISNSARRP